MKSKFAVCNSQQRTFNAIKINYDNSFHAVIDFCFYRFFFFFVILLMILPGYCECEIIFAFE